MALNQINYEIDQNSDGELRLDVVGDEVQLVDTHRGEVILTSPYSKFESKADKLYSDLLEVESKSGTIRVCKKHLKGIFFGLF